MAHQSVVQLQFARNKFLLILRGLSDEDARTELGQSNSISWMVGHLAQFEQYLWLHCAQDITLENSLRDFGSGKPKTNPDFDAVKTAMKTVTAATDQYLEPLKEADMLRFLPRGGFKENIGTLLYRQTWHYWYHIGEAHMIRQQLGHTDLPAIIGNIPPGTGYID